MPQASAFSSEWSKSNAGASTHAMAARDQMYASARQRRIQSLSQDTKHVQDCPRERLQMRQWHRERRREPLFTRYMASTSILDSSLHQPDLLSSYASQLASRFVREEAEGSPKRPFHASIARRIDSSCVGAATGVLDARIAWSCTHAAACRLPWSVLRHWRSE